MRLAAARMSPRVRTCSPGQRAGSRPVASRRPIAPAPRRCLLLERPGCAPRRRARRSPGCGSSAARGRCFMRAMVSIGSSLRAVQVEDGQRRLHRARLLEHLRPACAEMSARRPPACRSCESSSGRGSRRRPRGSCRLRILRAAAGNGDWSVRIRRGPCRGRLSGRAALVDGGVGCCFGSGSARYSFRVLATADAMNVASSPAIATRRRRRRAGNGCRRGSRRASAGAAARRRPAGSASPSVRSSSTRCGTSRRCASPGRSRWSAGSRRRGTPRRRRAHEAAEHQAADQEQHADRVEHVVDVEAVARALLMADPRQRCRRGCRRTS